jgi:hypothetical protein
MLKVAQIAAELEMYEVAIEKFEKVAAASVDDALLKWSLKEYFLKAGLCHLCTGVRNIREGTRTTCSCIWFIGYGTNTSSFEQLL